MPVLVTCKNEADLKNIEAKRVEIFFSYFKSMEAMCFHGKQICKPIYPKTLYSLSPYLIIVDKKFDQDCPAGS